MKLLLLGFELFHSGFYGFQVRQVHLQEQCLFSSLLLYFLDSFSNFFGVSGGDVDFRIVC